MEQNTLPTVPTTDKDDFDEDGFAIVEEDFFEADENDFDDDLFDDPSPPRAPIAAAGPLPMLGVGFHNRGRLPPINDDTYAPLACTWYDNLVRIATIGEGSCFIHALLKGFYHPYQENNSTRYRLDTAAAVRRDLALLLGFDNPSYPGHTYWETTANGSFPRILMQQIVMENLVQQLNVDYGLYGLQRLFNSDSYLGDEIHQFISDIFNVDIFVFLATREDISPVSNTRQFEQERDAVVIIGNTYHYEVVGVDTPDGFQTVFPPGDPFIQRIIERFNLEWFDEHFDPDPQFITNAVDIFTTYDQGQPEFKLPPLIHEMFTVDDPFKITLDRLLPQIIQTAEDKGLKVVLGPETLEETLDPEILDPEALEVEYMPVALRRELEIFLQIMQDSGYEMEDLESIQDWLIYQIAPGENDELLSIDILIERLDENEDLGSELMDALRIAASQIEAE